MDKSNSSDKGLVYVYKLHVECTILNVLYIFASMFPLLSAHPVDHRTPRFTSFLPSTTEDNVLHVYKFTLNCICLLCCCIMPTGVVFLTFEGF